MKNRLGFHTNAFVWAGVKDIETMADFAAEEGFDFIEVGPGIPLDLKAFRRAEAKGITFDAFIYCRNFIDDDEALRRKETEELYRRMDFAAEAGAERFILSTGISRARSLPPEGGCDPLKSLEPAVSFLEEAILRAKQNELLLCLENCPMYRNIATSPLMWRAIFGALEQKGLGFGAGLCFDPSHFVWQMIDVYGPVSEFGERIKHVHLKDTALRPEKLNEVGILHNTGSAEGFEENQWWRHCLIGDGEIDWPRFLSLLARCTTEAPALSFEQEDYRYEHEPRRVCEGLRI